MNGFMAYQPTGSVVHAVDARVKLLVLILFSIVALCVPSWIGVGACAAILLAVMLASRVPLRTYARTLLPAAAILVFIWICNSIPFEAERSMHALSYVVRISLVIVASFVITFTTTSTQLTDALASILRPLRALRVPVDDVAFTLSLALRFIPLVFEQLGRTKLAQTSRGAQFNTGSLWRRLKTWMVVLIPLFVGFFRRANTVAEAMDARCYGAARRTSLNDPDRTPKHKI